VLAFLSKSEVRIKQAREWSEEQHRSYNCEMKQVGRSVFEMEARSKCMSDWRNSAVHALEVAFRLTGIASACALS
jgi:hypothetical protein